MIPVTLLCIGSLKTPWAKVACSDYSGRLSVEIIEVPASKQKDVEKQRAEECVNLLKHLEKQQGQLWVLDERGQSFTSEEFSEALSTQEDRGEPVVFVLGGAYGLTEEIRQKAQKLVRLTDMTLPHELCRVLFLEQLYRADQIQKGSGYHHK